MDTAAILVSQYHAALEMLRETIAKCPESVWNDPADTNKFWQVAYHTLFFTHLYVAESEEVFRPWSKHRGDLHDFPAPETAEPYDKETILEYLDFCRQEVAERVPQLKLDEMERVPEPEMLILELQIYSIRHIMQHVGELMERLGARTGAAIEWVGWAHG